MRPLEKTGDSVPLLPLSQMSTDLLATTITRPCANCCTGTVLRHTNNICISHEVFERGSNTLSDASLDNTLAHEAQKEISAVALARPPAVALADH
jgi:hypothetical protein